MGAKLGIEIIPASSPQAKGRVERNHGTHQDRLVKKLRRRGIADIAGANTFLETEYWAAHNARFTQPARDANDFHVAVARGCQLDLVFRLEDTRVVSNDWVVRYHNRLLQLQRQSGHAPARSTVVVYEEPGGRIEIRYRDQVMRWTEIYVASAARVRSVSPPPTAPTPPVVATRRYHPARDHPWRKDIEKPGPPIWQVIDR